MAAAQTETPRCPTRLLYVCPCCAAKFTQLSNYKVHVKRKFPCKPENPSLTYVKPTVVTAVRMLMRGTDVTPVVYGSTVERHEPTRAVGRVDEGSMPASSALTAGLPALGSQTQPSTMEASGELLAMLRDEMSGEEQEMFVTGFQAYLHHDPKKDFVVSLDDAYEWLGYTRKDTTKDVIVKCLVEGTHYKIDKGDFPEISGKPLGAGLFAPEISGAKIDTGSSSVGRGGHNKETLVMTLHGFKQLCMAAGTDKARRVREYYITMEGVLFTHAVG